MCALQAEAAEAAPTASNKAGLQAEPLTGGAADRNTTASGRKLLDSFLPAAALHELQRRRLLQKADSLSPLCQALVVLAEPTDAFAQYQTSLSASVATTQVESLETKLGLSRGTLSSQNNSSGLTLTGWTALFGIFAIFAVSAAGAVLGYRRYKGLDKHSGYTMVKKARGKQLELNGSASS